MHAFSIRSLAAVCAVALTAFGPALPAPAAPSQAFAQHPANAGVPPLKDISGVLPWSRLDKVDSYKARDGRLLPKYPDAVLALDEQPVRLQGYMMPLEPGSSHTHFLLTVTTPSCPYCIPAGPEGVVEVRTSTPVKFTWKAIVVAGQMHVLKSDPMGLYYRLTGATPVTP